ncbi:MAG: hypothetical protein J6B23_06430, partial [Clostridia bacterium]|nr:hypothetical protein [Clostridia bacterium]
MKKYLSVFLALVLMLSLAAPAYAGGEVLNLIPFDGEVVYEAPQSFSAYCEDAETIRFYLDGIFVGEADDNGELKAPELAFGKHSLSAVAVMADGSALRDEVTFEYRQNVVFSSQSQDFSGFAEGSNATKFGFNFGNSSSATLTPMTGASGEDGDTAV